jgi:hypothetical protein
MTVDPSGYEAVSGEGSRAYVSARWAVSRPALSDPNRDECRDATCVRSHSLR